MNNSKQKHRNKLRTAGDRAFGAAAPRLWNSLPDDVVTSQSLATFKERLKLFVQTVTPLTTIDFVTCLCSHLGLRKANVVELTYLFTYY